MERFNVEVKFENDKGEHILSPRNCLQAKSDNGEKGTVRFNVRKGTVELSQGLDGECGRPNSSSTMSEGFIRGENGEQGRLIGENGIGLVTISWEAAGVESC